MSARTGITASTLHDNVVGIAGKSDSSNLGKHSRTAGSSVLVTFQDSHSGTLAKDNAFPIGGERATGIRGKHAQCFPWSFGPSLNLPILDGGSLRANVERIKSKATISYLNWKSTVLKAVEQVENALVAMHRDACTVQALKAAVKTAEETLKLSTSSYKDGASSLLDLLEAQRSFSVTQVSLATAIQQSAKDYVRLINAIGGRIQPVSKERF